MVLFYLVEAAQTESGGLTAQVPDGVSWVGQPAEDGQSYFVKTIELIPGLTPIPPEDLPDVCAERGLELESVLDKWKIQGQK